MSLPTAASTPLDPNLWTGMARFLGNPVRTGDVELDVPYGENGKAEFSTWLYVGVTGNINYVKWDGTSQTLVGVVGGQWHRIPSIMINTGTGADTTTALNLVWGS